MMNYLNICIFIYEYSYEYMHEYHCIYAYQYIIYYYLLYSELGLMIYMSLFSRNYDFSLPFHLNIAEWLNPSSVLSCYIC